MKHLQKLKLVAQQQRRLLTKVEQRRAKLISKLEEQLALAEALIGGERYEPLRRVWATSSDGERVRIERPKRVRPWYWLNAAGCFFSVYYGSKLLKLDGEMTAVALGDRLELPDTIRAIIEAVRAGELDLAIEEVAEKGIPDVSLRGASKGIDHGYK
ncbi:hypothetical protein KIH24_15110 [Rhizobiales bacterium TNE-4]|nr:hypothetical protein [Rhizobiales bacterium TNE-4]MBV1828952.1 hypothetical protein [Rhizobiales bacterium TNE-4]